MPGVERMMSMAFYQHAWFDWCNVRSISLEVTSLSGSCKEWRVVNIIVLKLVVPI